jgi:hypothetical protein
MRQKTFRQQLLYPNATEKLYVYPYPCLQRLNEEPSHPPLQDCNEVPLHPNSWDSVRKGQVCVLTLHNTHPRRGTSPWGRIVGGQ